MRNVVRRDGELLSIPVRKVWRGGTGAGVTVQLYRGTEGDEKMEGRVLLLGEHNGWEGVFENLQRHDAAGRGLHLYGAGGRGRRFLWGTGTALWRAAR